MSKSSAEQAVPTTNPVTPPDFIKKVLEESARLDTQPLPEDDKLFLELSKSDAWRALKKIIGNKQKRLEELTAQTVRKNPSNLQEVGLRYLIADQIGGALQSVIDRVELPAKMEILHDNQPTEE